jgi:putative ABC transport system permease protein
MSNPVKNALSALTVKLLWRDWRGGELNVLIAALLVAVTTVTGIGLFSDRIRNSILDEASSLLAADAQISGSQPIETNWIEQAKAANLETASIVSFQAMAFGNEGKIQLASVKAVSNEYPLKGVLEVSDVPYGPVTIVSKGPQAGQAWVNSRVMAALGVELGDVIGVGDADLTVANVLVKEPDSQSGGLGFAPRVLINETDVGATGAVQVGSRVSYRLLLAGDVEPFKTQWLPEKGEHHRWRDVKDANDSITETLERAESFLLLAGALGVVLGGVALALASKRYALRQLGHVALLKTLGLTPKNIATLYAGNLVILGVIVVALGLFSGWFLHWAFLEVFSGLFPRELEPATARPLLIGVLTGFVCLFAFAFPPVWMLRNTPPSRVLRSDMAGGTLSQARTMVLGAVAVVGLVYFYSKSLSITAAVVIAGAVAVIGVSFLARGMIYIAKRIASRLGTTWRLGLASLQRHSSQNSFQIVIFSLSLMLLFILTLLRTSLLTQWQDQLPEGTPNHFAFNIFEEDRGGLEDIFARNDIASTPFYPMIRGRLTEVNDELMADRIERLNPDGDDFRRELNNTWGDTLAPDNEVVEGEWFDAEDAQRNLVSIEQDYAASLEIVIGDELVFSFGGQDVVVTVDNIRTVQWDSLSPNFYVIFSSPILGGAGAANLTSFYLTPEQKPVLVEILQAHPTITVIEVDAIIEQIQGIVGQVTRAIEFILSLVLVAGLIVLIASVQATLDSRLKESAILRTIGARAKLIRGALAIEFVALGALAGILAVAGAEVTLYFLQTELLKIEYQASYWLWLIGPISGGLLIGLVGMVSTRKVVSVPPMTVLRQL